MLATVVPGPEASRENHDLPSRPFARAIASSEKHALACGQLFWTGRPQYPFDSVWVAMPYRVLAHWAWPRGPSGSRVTRSTLPALPRDDLRTLNRRGIGSETVKNRCG